jgi:hypothetical protein
MQAYPLSWPEGWKRTPDQERKAGHFSKKQQGTTERPWQTTKKLSIIEALDRVLYQVERIHANSGRWIDRQDVIISTNVRTRLDGLPRSGEREPLDPGAAVYWRDGKETRCMAVDIYLTVADNLAAIAATLEAMRAIERHGGAEIMNRTFRGFAALPEAPDWRKVLGFVDSNGRASGPITTDEITRRYREMAKTAHPDVGGDPGEFMRLTEARDQAMKEVQ